MPAPRTCRRCGESLNPNVPWCDACAAPVTEFTPRPPLHEDGFVGTPMHDIKTSRWMKSPTTFGPLGRLVVTGALVLFLLGGLQMSGGAFSPFGLWFFLGWSVLAGFVMRETWRPVRVEGQPSGRIGIARQRFAGRFPRLGRSHDRKALIAPFAAVGAGLGVYVWTTGDGIARFGIVVGVGITAAVAVLLRLTNN